MKYLVEQLLFNNIYVYNQIYFDLFFQGVLHLRMTPAASIPHWPFRVASGLSLLTTNQWISCQSSKAIQGATVKYSLTYVEFVTGAVFYSLIINESNISMRQIYAIVSHFVFCKNIHQILQHSQHHRHVHMSELFFVIKGSGCKPDYRQSPNQNWRKFICTIIQVRGPLTSSVLHPVLLLITAYWNQKPHRPRIT